MTIVYSHQTALSIYFENPSLGLLPRVAVPVDGHVRRKQVEFMANRACVDVLVKKASLRGAQAGSLVCHILPAQCPEESFIPWEGYALACPELCFVQMAASLDLINLVLLGYRLCGDYRPSELRFRTGNLPLTTPEKLSAYVEKCAGCKGAKKARRALRFVLADSNSTMETRLTMALILPRRWGGYGLSRPTLNEEIFGTSRTGDLCWLDKGVVVEYDSASHHAEPFAQERDSARRAEIGLRDVRVITVSRMQVADPRLFDQVARYIAKSLGESMESRSPSCEPCRAQLLDRLFHHFDEGKMFCGKTK